MLGEKIAFPSLLLNLLQYPEPTPAASKGDCSMGNYRFKFSDMIPNAWFYKLRDLTKQPTKNHKTKKKLHHNASISNQTHVNSPALTSPSSSMRDRQPHHHHHHHHPSSSFSSQSQYQRKSYYFTRDINKSASPVHDDSSRPPGNFYEEANGVVQLPRRSSNKRRSTRRSRASPRLANSSVRTGYSCRSSVESLRTNLPDSTCQESPNSAADTSSETDSVTQPKSVVTGVTSTETIESTVFSSYSWSSSRLEDDIVIDLKSRPPPATQFDKHVDDNKWKYADFDSDTKIELPPVKTKSNINKEIQPTKTRRQSAKSEESMKIIKNDEKSSQQSKRFSISSHSPGLKLRTNTPRMVTQRIRSRKSVSSNWRKSLSDSFAVVTSSKDPQRDFRESMVEMIVEHNICSTKELEDLLACYLSLNSYKHHDVIINVFKQIWFEFVHT